MTGSQPKQLTYNKGIIYFHADDGVHGRELWRSDGTEAGTVMVKDINTIVDSLNLNADAFWIDFFITSIDDTLYFVAFDGIHGYELWRSDGTNSGTQLVKDIAPGAQQMGPDRYGVTQVGHSFYFNGYSTQGRCALWKSDGTANGTITLKDFSPVVGQSCPSNITNVNGTLFFSASDESFGDELWKSDGTETGTVMVKDINLFLAAGSTPRNFVSSNSKLYFTAEDMLTGRELWVSNGSQDGTHIAKDIIPGKEDPNIFPITNYKDTLFFIAGSSNSSDCKERLWVSDGTEIGTKLFSDCKNDSRNKNLDLLFSWNQPTNIHGKLYFVVNNMDGGNSVWRSDGTEFGTSLIIGLTTKLDNVTFATDAYSANYKSLVFPDGRFLMRSANDISGLELWIGDDTEEGTHIVKDINPGRAGGYSW